MKKTALLSSASLTMQNKIIVIRGIFVNLSIKLKQRVSINHKKCYFLSFTANTNVTLNCNITSTEYEE